MIELRDVSIKAGQFSMEHLSLRIEAGEYAVLMGRTGQGKTTILEAVCGLRPVTAGHILIRDHDVTDWSPGDRGIGYVPQDLALFPTLSVREHLAFALRIKRQSKRSIDQRIRELAKVLGISKLLNRSVKGLSGGESQRVALGRALSFRPSVLLLDEPLSSLDDCTRQQMYDVLKSVQIKTGVTTLHVTHSRDEANHLADTLFHLQDGRIAFEKCMDDLPRESPSEEIVS